MTVFENADWWVVYKPASVSAQEDLTEGPSLLQEYPGAHVLTRLDKRVSGLMVLAKTAEAAGKWKPELFRKKYRCVVPAPGPGEAGRLRHYLKKEGAKAKVFKEPFSGAKAAVLHYSCVQTSERYVMLEIELETGRFHQIRAQLSAAGFPLLGDLKYGAKRNTPDGSIYLCCTAVEAPDFKVEIPFPEAWCKYGFAPGVEVGNGG